MMVKFPKQWLILPLFPESAEKQQILFWEMFME